MNIIVIKNTPEANIHQYFWDLQVQAIFQIFFANGLWFSIIHALPKDTSHFDPLGLSSCCICNLCFWLTNDLIFQKLHKTWIKTMETSMATLIYGQTHIGRFIIQPCKEMQQMHWFSKCTRLVWIFFFRFLSLWAETISLKSITEWVQTHKHNPVYDQDWTRFDHSLVSYRG